MRTTATGTINAPVPLVGRDAELTALRARLLGRDVRLITVTGQVGVGKSRLVTALFDEVRGRFTGGAAFLDLTGTDLDGVDVPRDRHFLLALDGCEDHHTETLAALVTAHPKLTVLVAAPARLGVYGEAVVRLAPLQLPDVAKATDLTALERVPAVRLFVERTRAVRPDFTLTDANRAAVTELCVWTDGVPLAIELLAARMELSSPQRLLAELNDDPDGLAGDGSVTLSRHHSMTAAVEWSLARLGTEERQSLERLAVFTGHFDAAAAGAVGRAPRLLAGLVDKNLLSTTECQDGDLIFRMSVAARRHIVRRQAHVPARRAHAEHFLGMAAQARTALRGPEQTRWHELLDGWHADIVAALSFLRESGDDSALIRLASDLRDHWLAGRLSEGVRWLSTPTRLTSRGAEVLGDLLLAMGQRENAERRYTQAAAGYRLLDDSAGVARCERGLGVVAHHSGALAAAGRLLRTSVARLSGVDHAVASLHLAEYLLDGHGPQQAKTAAEAALREFTRHQDGRGVAQAQYVLADIADAAGDRAEALRLCRKALGSFVDATGLERLAVLLAGGRDRTGCEHAMRALGAAAAMRESTGHAASPALRAASAEAESLVRARLGDQAVGELRADGAAQPVHVVVAEALAPLERRSGRGRSWNEHPLTDRELEVAELVACGMTNREVARRLGIAEWTAVNHLRKIMRKLDCSSRVQVASWMTTLER
ncbi:LuxR C-terminal-related transcriptional regulator [Kibdelosporangium persicum]|uniref:ATPase n=1 Tax=Kibdelosporangium persicum TaxID=2698649 RepID=A0ABX2EW29_9PSEU|nr:LuxR C-terminal-related transcriptional regulator [Kibdelosporangium persicum]NRN63233.1 putative ATPase [Kibdelosporangium persicum]